MDWVSSELLSSLLSWLPPLPLSPFPQLLHLLLLVPLPPTPKLLHCAPSFTFPSAAPPLSPWAPRSSASVLSSCFSLSLSSLYSVFLSFFSSSSLSLFSFYLASSWSFFPRLLLPLLHLHHLCEPKKGGQFAVCPILHPSSFLQKSGQNPGKTKVFVSLPLFVISVSSTRYFSDWQTVQ